MHSKTNEIWFLDTYVRVVVPHSTGSDGISVLDSVARRGDSPPLHVHANEDETFHVLEGTLRLHVDGEDHIAQAGEWMLAPKGVPHTYRVESDEEATWIVATTNGEFAAFVAEASVPAETDGYAPELLVPLEEIGAAAARHSIELLGPPGTLPS
jgi:quercetin dioxygenase-like cupin family protein